MSIDELVWVRRVAATGSARAMREAANLTLQDIADELGVFPSTVWRWERNERRPGRDLALRWAGILRRLGA